MVVIAHDVLLELADWSRVNDEICLCRSRHAFVSTAGGAVDACDWTTAMRSLPTCSSVLGDTGTGCCILMGSSDITVCVSPCTDADATCDWNMLMRSVSTCRSVPVKAFVSTGGRSPGELMGS